MVLTALNKCMILFFILKCCKSSDNPGQRRENITKLYELIAGAINNDLNKPQSRRVINDSGYQIHINRLKDVNGFKMHNILINHTDTNTTIYIDNPLESKLSHPFMTLEEFKNAIVEQRLNDRKAFLRSKKTEEDRKKWSDIKAKAKLKSKRTYQKQTYTRTISSKKTKSIVAKTKSLTEKQSDIKVENIPKTARTKIFTKTTKEKQNSKEHINMTVKEKATVQTMFSNTTDFPENSRFSPEKSRVQSLSYDQDSPIGRAAEQKILKNVSNIGEAEQNITIVFDENDKTTDDRDPTTTNTTAGKDEIADKYEEFTTAAERQSSAVNKINSTYRNERESTISKSKITGNDENESSSLEKESSTPETEPTTSDEEQLTTVDEKGATNDDENKALSEETEETNEASMESSTTTTTSSQATTTREKWSRPRVYMGPMADSAGGSTSSLVT